MEMRSINIKTQKGWSKIYMFTSENNDQLPPISISDNGLRIQHEGLRINLKNSSTG